MLEQITGTLARAVRITAGTVAQSGGWLMLGALLPATLFAATASTTFIDFGTVVPGLSVTQNFTVTPAATSTSTQLVVTYEVAPGAFTVSPQSRSGTAPFEVTVTFQPNAIGEFFSAQIDIIDCAGQVCSPGGSVALQGESETGVFFVNDGEVPALNFGDVRVGEMSQPLTFRVSATTREQAPLAIQVSTSSPALNVTPSSFQVHQNISQDVSVVFRPTTSGPLSAQLTVTGKFAASGFDLPVPVAIPVTASATVDTSLIDFGLVVPGLSVSRNFTVSPPASSASTRLVVTNEDPPGIFSVSPESRAGNSPFQATATFRPNANGEPFNAQINILYCTPDCGLGGVVELRGESEGGSFSVNDGELPVLDFGDVSVGDGSQPLTFRVSASTRQEAPVAIQVSSSNLALTVTPPSFQVHRDKSQEVSVVFAPTTPGPVNGQLTVTGKFAASGFDVPFPVAITATGNGQAQLAIATSSIDAGTVGRPYNEPLVGAGGDPPYQWSLTSGELPPGLGLVPNGAIQGTPEVSGVWAVTFTLTDSSGVAVRRDFQITIADPLVITTESLPPGAVGVAYNQFVAASGGIPPLRWARLSGTLPDGLFLTAAGAINGTPSSAGSWTVALRVTDSVGVEASREWTIRITDEGNQTEPPQVTAMVNAASFVAGLPVTPGSLVSIFGTGLASDIAGAASIPIGTQLLDTRVLLNGIPAPLLYVTPGSDGNPAQINAQVPWEVLGGGGASSGNLTLVVEVGGVASDPQEVPVAEFSPGIFAIQFGIGQAVAANALTGVWAAPPGVIVGATPIQRGEYLSIFCTGLGAVDPPAQTGNNSLDQTRFTLTAPTVLFGDVATAGLAAMSPEFVGVYQVNVPVPENAPVGDAVPLRIRVGEYTSRDDVTVAIQ